MEEGRELPVGWVDAQVGELVDVGPKNDCHDDTQVGFVPLQRLGVDYLARHSHEPKTWREVKKGYTHFQDGDVLLARITPSFENGKAGIARGLPNGIGAGSTEYIVCRPYPDVLDPRYLLAHFKTRPFLLGGEMVMTGAVGQQRVPKSFVLKSNLPLAPLNEQRRIAAKLDTTLAAVDACRQRLDGVEALLKRFRQAVLAAATSGELTREWREENGEKETKRLVRLGDVILEMRNGLSPKPSLTPPGVKILRIGAIRPGLVDFEDYRYLDLAPRDAEQYALRDGDLIFTRYNGTLEFVGVCALVKNVPCSYVYPDKLIRVRCKEEAALPAYVELAFGSAAARDQIESLVKSSAGQKGVSGSDLKGVRFSLPSIPEQVEIVRRAQQLFSLADQLEARLTSARKVIERLTPALLAKAFRGELVPQDPNDEPASVLLERLAAKKRAARQAEAAASGPSRRGRRQAAAKPEPSLFDAAPVPPDRLANLLRECGALSERALLAASELDPAGFRAQLALERELGAIQETLEDGQVLLEAVG